MSESNCRTSPAEMESAPVSFSLLMTALAASMSAIPPAGGGVALFAVCYFSSYLTFALELKRRPEKLNRTLDTLKWPLGEDGPPAGVAIKMAAAGIASLAVIAAILGDTSLTGRGAWVIMAAVACGLSDAAMVRAVPPHTLRGVLVRAARALLASWRSRRAAPGHGPHGPKDSNGRGKEPVDHDFG